MLGLNEICFTDHIDFDENITISPPPDIISYSNSIKELALERSKLSVKFGAEIGLKDHETFQLAWNYIKDYHPDFIIGSVHYTDDGDAFNKQFFEGRSQKEVYYSYYSQAVNRCCCTSNYSVLGHIDYIAKKAPYLDRNVSLDSNP